MLNIKKLSFSIGGTILFDDTSVNIPTGQKVGIVGRNGTGKTSLFKIHPITKKYLGKFKYIETIDK